MKQPIPGVAPAALEEVTVMAIWPGVTSVSLPPFGRAAIWMGRCFRIRFGSGPILNLGNLFALMSIPFILPPYFLSLIPGIGVPKLFSWIPGWLWISNPLCRRYRLTNRRVVVEHGLGGPEQRSVALDRFDEIDVVVHDGQEWYPAGDLVFRLGQVETFRLEGITRPDAFRHACLKSQRSFAGVQKAREAGVAV